MRVDVVLLRDILFRQSAQSQSEHSNKLNVDARAEAARLYDSMYTTEGLAGLQYWFSLRATKKLVGASSVLTFGEDEFVLFGREVTQLTDHQLLDWLDYLDVEDQGELYFEQVFIFIAIALSAYGKVLTKFWFRHSSAIWRMLRLDSVQITTADLATRLAYFLNIREKVILVEMRQTMYNPDAVTYDDFDAFYFSIFSQYDADFPAYEAILARPEPRQNATDPKEAPDPEPNSSQCCCIIS
ncbi:uncharacterized protein AMSG_10896 [Thecamonas trahens ATCC 50062]|uniref:Uncharacterized protein n=1 Tax=Thecamonas trahens ATCC 50062 TaxID=461836 RepID=A0A0L0DSE1_THETB|nr:hypothetical protein AMSG_10896 [Thecamonas trahens ATCC 50062]KNC55259.1 hypothetical protein AMSG_10896 [Thecamonas trahens ATCC 50062]|eukprot:XP_013753187.1 hypothetical protein AMSG_10896 [Thecamonas trahens ATCC 50062]